MGYDIIWYFIQFNEILIFIQYRYSFKKWNMRFNGILDLMEYGI